MKELEHGAMEDFLEHQVIGHLGTIRSGRPHVIPVAYVYEDQTVYFATEPGAKLDTLQGDAEACFEVDEYHPEIGEYRSVLGYGRASVVDDPQVRERILRALIGRFERQAAPLARRKDYPAHLMSGHGDQKDLVVVALPLQELHGREAA
jgi:nitroimidazol reductase NimA-like FMN-containing flavoprotein (pyridoxamine 5'-phosphate oxidase superfamily)